MLFLLGWRFGVARNLSRWGFSASDGYRVYADILLGVLKGQRGCQCVYSALGGRIRHAMNAARGDGGDIDDDAGLLFEKIRQDGAAAPKRRKQSAADFLLDFVFLIVGVGFGPDGAADIVDENVNRAKMLVRPGP